MGVHTASQHEGSATEQVVCRVVAQLVAAKEAVMCPRMAGENARWTRSPSMAGEATR